MCVNFSHTAMYIVFIMQNTHEVDTSEGYFVVPAQLAWSCSKYKNTGMWFSIRGIILQKCMSHTGTPWTDEVV